MEYRRIGNTDIELSAIAFGAWAIGGWMWGGAERKDAIDAIRTSFDHGVSTIDTAPVYGQGSSEEIVGEAIQGVPRDKIQILTKFGMRWDEKKGSFAFASRDNSGREIEIYKYAGRDSIIKECEDSLRRLRTGYIDLYQIHWPDITTPIAETMEAVTRLLEQGKILAAGVCNYNVEQMREAENTIALASNQVPYSMLERNIEKEVVPYCLEHKKSILAYSPLQRGLLTGKIKPGHRFAEGDHRPDNVFFKEANIMNVNAFLEKIKPIAEQKQVTLSQLVLRWTIGQPGITVALAGARNAAQAAENAGAMKVSLTKDESGYISQQLDALQLVK